MTDEKLRTEITKNDFKYRRVVNVEIEAVGSHKETFEALRDAVNEVLEDV